MKNDRMMAMIVIKKVWVCHSRQLKQKKLVAVSWEATK